MIWAGGERAVSNESGPEGFEVRVKYLRVGGEMRSHAGMKGSGGSGGWPWWREEWGGESVSIIICTCM